MSAWHLLCRALVLIILFYLLSCIGAPNLAYLLQVAFDEEFSSLIAALLACFGMFTIGLPLLMLLFKHRYAHPRGRQGL